MLTIRLSRIGKKKKPIYRLIISEKTKDPYGRALEILGTYNPFTKELAVKQDRIEHWLKNGSGMSPSVNNLLIEKKIIKGDKVTASKPGKKKKEAEEKKQEAKPDEKKEPSVAEAMKGEEVKTEENKAKDTEKKTEATEKLDKN
ncbi:30S ribosomal protein S16 [Candidatus Parcubacteria bacterium]|nr:30S ribosomal protein S16 [Candidatus Parcubacteria bacterium]